jgi:hypothetical protein
MPLPISPSANYEDDPNISLRTIMVHGNHKFPTTTATEWTWSLTECDLFDQWTRNTGLSGMSTNEQWQLVSRQMPKSTYNLMDSLMSLYHRTNSLPMRPMIEYRLADVLVILKAIAPGSDADNHFSDYKSLATNLRAQTGTTIPMSSEATKIMVVQVNKLLESVPTLLTNKDFFARNIKLWCDMFRPSDRTDSNAQHIYGMFYNQIMYDDTAGLRSAPLQSELDPIRALTDRLLQWSIYIEKVHVTVSIFGNRIAPTRDNKPDSDKPRQRHRNQTPKINIPDDTPRRMTFPDCYRCNKGHAHPESCGFATHPDVNNDPNKKWSDTNKGKIWTQNQRFSLDWYHMVQGNALIPMTDADKARFGHVPTNASYYRPRPTGIPIIYNNMNVIRSDVPNNPDLDPTPIPILSRLTKTRCCDDSDKHVIPDILIPTNVGYHKDASTYIFVPTLTLIDTGCVQANLIRSDIAARLTKQGLVTSPVSIMLRPGVGHSTYAITGLIEF